MSLENFNEPNKYEIRFTCVGCGGEIERESICSDSFRIFPEYEQYRQIFYCFTCQRYLCSNCAIIGFFGKGHCPVCDSKIRFPGEIALIRWTNKKDYTLNEQNKNLMIIK